MTNYANIPDDELENTRAQAEADSQSYSLDMATCADAAEVLRKCEAEIERRKNDGTETTN